MCEACHEPEINGVSPGAENDGDVYRRTLCCYADGGLSCIYEVNFLVFEIPRCLLRCFQIALRVSYCQDKLFSLFKSQLSESDPEPVNCLVPRAACSDNTDSENLLLLRVGEGS